MEISFSQSLYMTEIASLPDYQNSYGNGFNQTFTQAFSNWGPAFGTAGTQGINADGTVNHPLAYYGSGVFPQFFDNPGNPLTEKAKTVPYARRTM